MHVISNPIEIRFRFSSEEYADAMKRFYRKFILIRKYKKTFPVFILLVFFGTMMYSFDPHGSFAGLALGIIFCFGGILVFLSLFEAWRFSDFVVNTERKKEFHYTSLVFSEEFITSRSEDYYSERKWANVKFYTLLHDDLFLFNKYREPIYILPHLLAEPHGKFEELVKIIPYRLEKLR